MFQLKKLTGISMLLISGLLFALISCGDSAKSIVSSVSGDLAGLAKEKLGSALKLSAKYKTKGATGETKFSIAKREKASKGLRGSEDTITEETEVFGKLKLPDEDKSFAMLGKIIPPSTEGGKEIPGKLSATAMSKDEKQRFQITADVTEDGEYSNIKIREALSKEKGDKVAWGVQKSLGDKLVGSDAPTDEFFGETVVPEKAPSLPAAMQGTWTMKLPSTDTGMKMKLKYVAAQGDIPEHFEMLPPDMNEMGMGGGTGGSGGGAGGGTGGAGGGTGGSGGGTGGSGGGTGGTTGEKADFVWKMTFPSEVTFIITGYSLQPVFPTVDKSNMDVTKETGSTCSLTVEQAKDLILTTMSPSNKKAKPMDLLEITKRSDKEYDVIAAEELEIPADVKKIFKDMGMPDGFGFIAYQKLRLTLNGKKLTQKMFMPQMGGAPSGGAPSGGGTTTMELPTCFDLGKTKKLTKVDSMGMEFTKK